MAAAAQVLETAELLENIILHVQADYIPYLKRVSKTWQELITTSPRIQPLITCLRPIPLSGYKGQDIPTFYPRGSRIALNPAFTLQHITFPIWAYPSTVPVDQDRLCLMALVDTKGIELLHNVQEEMVTKPPCRTILVQYRIEFFTNEQRPRPRPRLTRKVHVNSGVRIRHLFEAHRELVDEQRSMSTAQETHNDSYIDADTSCLIIHFAESIDHTDIAEFKVVNGVAQWKVGRPYRLRHDWPTLGNTWRIRND